MQYFGIGKIDGATQELAVSLHDLSGKKLWGVTLQPEA
jgi:alkaline phosphatase D